MHTQVAPYGEHKYNFRLTFRSLVGDRLGYFLNFWHFVIFLYTCVN